MKSYLSIISLSLFLAACGPSEKPAGSEQEDTPTEETTHVYTHDADVEQAESLWNTIRAGIGEDATAYGFDNPDQATASELGSPIAVLHLGLNDINAFEGTDPMSLLPKEVTEVVFPVTADGAVRSSMTMQKLDGHWTPTTFGSRNTWSGVRAAQIDHAKRVGCTTEETFVVYAPALYMMYVGSETEKDLNLTTVFEHEIVGIAGGFSSTLSEQIATLSKLAKDGQYQGAASAE